MLIELKKIQENSINKLIKIIDNFEELLLQKNSTLLNKREIYKYVNILSKENWIDLLEKVVYYKLIYFISKNLDCFSTEAFLILVKNNKNKDYSDNDLKTVINYHLSQLNETENKEDYNFLSELLVENNSKMNHYPEKKSLFDSFLYYVRNNNSNIGAIISHMHDSSEFSIKGVSEKFRDFFRQEKTDLLLNNHYHILSYPSTESGLSFIGGLEKSTDDEIIEVLKNIIRTSLKRDMVDNIERSLYLFVKILKASDNPTKEKLLDIFDIINNLEKITIHFDFEKDILMLLNYYHEHGGSKEITLFLLNRIKIIPLEKENYHLFEKFNEAFEYLFSKKDLFLLLLKHNFHTIYSIFSIYFNLNYSSGNFNRLNFEKDKDLSIADLINSQKIKQNMKFMYQYYFVYKQLHILCEKKYEDTLFDENIRQWSDFFTQQQVYLNVFESNFCSFTIQLIDYCQSKHSIDFENLRELDCKNFLIAANETAEIRWTIPSKNIEGVISYFLTKDWNKLLTGREDGIIFEIINKLFFLNKTKAHIVADQSISAEAKSLFFIKLGIFENNIIGNKYIEALKEQEFELSLTLTKRSIENIIKSEYPENYIYALNKSISLSQHDFFDLVYIVSTIKGVNILDKKEEIVSMFYENTVFNLTKTDFLLQNPEYNNAIFNKIISKYLD